MGKKIFLRILVLYPICVCLFLFLPAGSFLFWEAWVYSVTLLIPMVITVSYLVKNDPALLERRLKFKEKEKKQKAIVKSFTLPFIIAFLLPGFDYRFGWSDVPVYFVVISNCMVFLGYILIFFVFRENSYTSRIVVVEKDQKVISTGPYAIVRHPMYIGSILMFLFTSFALGSWWAIGIYIFLPVVLIIRILNEEALLRKELPGYAEYCQKVRYRLVPYIW